MSKIKLIFTADTLDQLRTLKQSEGITKRECSNRLGVNLVTLNRAADRAGLRTELTEIFPLSVFRGMESALAKSKARDIHSLSGKEKEEAVARYSKARNASNEARLMTDELLSEKHGIPHRNVSRISSEGLAYALGSRALQHIPPGRIKALCRDLKKRKWLLESRVENSATLMAKELRVDCAKFTRWLEYQLRKGPEKQEVAANDPAWNFLTMPAINPGQSLGYYGHG